MHRVICNMRACYKLEVTLFFLLRCMFSPFPTDADKFAHVHDC